MKLHHFQAFVAVFAWFTGTLVHFGGNEARAAYLVAGGAFFMAWAIYEKVTP